MSDGHGWYISPLQGFAHGWITAPPGTAGSTSRPTRSLHMRALGTAVSAGTGEPMAQPLPSYVLSGAGENLEVAVEHEQDHRIEYQRHNRADAHALSPPEEPTGFITASWR